MTGLDAPPNASRLKEEEEEPRQSVLQEEGFQPGTLDASSLAAEVHRGSARYTVHDLQEEPEPVPAEEVHRSSETYIVHDLQEPEPVQQPPRVRALPPSPAQSKSRPRRPRLPCVVCRRSRSARSTERERHGGTRRIRLAQRAGRAATMPGLSLLRAWPCPATRRDTRWALRSPSARSSREHLAVKALSQPTRALRPSPTRPPPATGPAACGGVGMQHTADGDPGCVWQLGRALVPHARGAGGARPAASVAAAHAKTPHPAGPLQERRSWPKQQLISHAGEGARPRRPPWLAA